MSEQNLLAGGALEEITASVPAARAYRVYRRGEPVGIIEGVDVYWRIYGDPREDIYSDRSIAIRMLFRRSERIDFPLEIPS